jgi:hypothetical protein
MYDTWIEAVELLVVVTSTLRLSVQLELQVEVVMAKYDTALTSWTPGSDWEA